MNGPVRADALRALARRLGPEVAQGAVQEASERARRILVERLTAELVAAAAGELESTASPPAEGEAPAPGQLTASDLGAGGCYLFAIAAHIPDGLDGLRGLDGRGPIETLVSGSLSAVVCSIDAGLLQGLDQEEVTEDSRLAVLAARHDAVVREVWRRGTALPMRFGIVLRSRQAALDLLTDRAHVLTGELERLAGCEEWSCRVRLHQQPDPVDAGPDDAAESTSNGGAGTAYLARRAEDLRHRREAGEQVRQACEDVDQSLSAFAEAVSPAATGRPDVAFGAAYLVCADRAPAFQAAAFGKRDELQERGAELSVDGPLPPFHFVRPDLLESTP